MSTNNDPLLRQITDALDQDLASMDDKDRQRLGAIRSKALRSAQHHGEQGFLSKLVLSFQAAPKPLAYSSYALAACAVMLAAYLGIRPAPPAHEPPLLADLDIMTADEPLEFYDNLDFYSWLAEMELDEG